MEGEGGREEIQKGGKYRRETGSGEEEDNLTGRNTRKIRVEKDMVE